MSHASQPRPLPPASSKPLLDLPQNTAAGKEAIKKELEEEDDEEEDGEEDGTEDSEADVCLVCGLDGDPDKLLRCSKCSGDGRGMGLYHMDCLRVKLESKPVGDVSGRGFCVL